MLIVVRACLENIEENHGINIALIASCYICKCFCLILYWSRFMRVRVFLGMILIFHFFSLTIISCGDDSEDDENGFQQPVDANSNGTGDSESDDSDNAGLPGNVEGSDNAAGNNPDKVETDEDGTVSSSSECTGISLAAIEKHPDYETVFYASYTPSTGDANLDDTFSMQFYADVTPGEYDLGSEVDNNYSTCTHCMLIYEDVAENSIGKTYFQESGKLVIGEPVVSNDGKIKETEVLITKLKLIEVTIADKEENYVSTPVDGGGCIEIETGGWKLTEKEPEPIPNDPGEGPGPDCPDLPEMTCSGSDCGTVMYFDPEEGPGYINYPLNGETSDNQYRSYLRKDAMMMIKYATAKVACKSANWEFGNQGIPLGLGDMSEEDGAIPGTSVNSPGHPEGTHTNGFDIDIAYYMNGTDNNYLQAICKHHDENGKEQYHCVEEPTKLDPWRTALLIGALYEYPNLRVIGADGKAGPIIKQAFKTLCDKGWIDENACKKDRLAYEETDQGYGWFRFHHHHMHVSYTASTMFRGANPEIKAVEIPKRHPQSAK